MAIYIANGTDFLMHYGVKGMKWGVRQQKRYDRLMAKYNKANRISNDLSRQGRGASLAKAFGGAAVGYGIGQAGAKAGARIAGRGVSHLANGNKAKGAALIGAGYAANLAGGVGNFLTSSRFSAAAQRYKANRALYKAKKMKGTATLADKKKGSLLTGNFRAIGEVYRKGGQADRLNKEYRRRYKK